MTRHTTLERNIMVTQIRPKKRPVATLFTANAGHRNCVVALQRVSDALIAAGYTTLDAQAKALGVQRSTAWTIVRAKHKLGRLSEKTRRRILDNPHLPPTVRAIFQQYLYNRNLD